jgi:flagellar protein FliS
MNAASEYRRRAVETASPVGLIVLLYDGVLTSLRRALAAMENNDVEGRVKELNHALKILTEMQMTLNFEKGDEVARNLENFYAVMRSQILKASIQNSRPMVEELVRHVSSVKEAWQQVDQATGVNGLASLAASNMPAVAAAQTMPVAIGAR